ncbi:MAG TPA: ABC transporter ATP-binding protein [Verrucomicrobiae bacterium]|jgi:lipopolysaccharide transport system ATP-binding protein
MPHSDTVIAVKNLSKCYSIGHLNGATGVMKYNPPGLRHAIEYAVRNPLAWWKSKKVQDEHFWALADASFDVKAGEVVAVIGRNGAGKSTLLKILSRITEPTRGRIEITGRVASLLEVGTGFHAELTGRENIFLNGAILGMTRAEIKRKFDEIVAFSEVEKFLDTPVKRYSSGMYVRLAFAVAAHLEPEILIVDEVLAVGDSAFQKKCLGKMQEVSRNHGRTVLFVSHNMSAVLQLTSRAVVLDKGRVIFNGPTEKAVEEYAGTIGNDSTIFFPVENAPRKYPGTEAVRFISFRFDRPVPIFSPDEDFQFIARVRANETVQRIRFSMTIFTPEGVPVGTCFGTERPGLNQGEESEFEISIPRPRLAHGRYCCGVSIGKGDHRVGMVDFDTIVETLAFEVRPEEGDGGTVAEWPRGWGSIILPDLKCRPACHPSFEALADNVEILSV